MPHRPLDYCHVLGNTIPANKYRSFTANNRHIAPKTLGLVSCSGNYYTCHQVQKFCNQQQTQCPKDPWIVFMSWEILHLPLSTEALQPTTDTIPQRPLDYFHVLGNTAPATKYRSFATNNRHNAPKTLGLFSCPVKYYTCH